MSTIPPPIMRFNLDNLYKTDSGHPPPSKPPSTPDTGKYCIRVTSDLMRGEDSIKTFTGYSETMDIIKKVEDACAKRMVGTKEYTECTAPKLFFMKNHPKCDGRVEEKINV